MSMKNCFLLMSALFFVYVFAPCSLFSLSSGQSPLEELWLEFITAGPESSRLPEDAEMGLLANRRNPDPYWASALDVCEKAFISIRKGEVPGNELHPDFRMPLSLIFSRILAEGGIDVYPRYALPRRKGNRVSVQVLLKDEGKERYGFIYLSRLEGTWFIDQWMLDLSGYTGKGRTWTEPDTGTAQENKNVSDP